MALKLCEVQTLKLLVRWCSFEMMLSTPFIGSINNQGIKDGMKKQVFHNVKVLETEEP